ncbi:hypothetical protein [Amycolatopsis keratiniphila]|uniref:Uncharacterized protein n=1 Tax=Amycolatopsis keratiniphila TaxID=129921 RepID=R4TD72_9PSEU|nr:hypothetical protein [Amycolatopsis keratiniphila]AGM08737.1 hypothetical protein AORI_6154 [Amycolatopsis keratiniphila]
MTFDIIGLCERQPDAATTIEALLAAGPDLLVADQAENGVTRLLRSDGRPLVIIEDIRQVQVPGEAHRLLGIDAETEVPNPVWWVESRARDDDPEAEAVARAFTRALVERTGGLSWSNR